MKMPFAKVFLATAIIAAVVPSHTYAENSVETISYNYVYDNISGYRPENVHNRQMEKLGRGLTAVRTADGVYLSWRLLDSEDCIYGSADDNVSFNIYRDNETEPIANVTYSTNYIDKTVGASYRVTPVINGIEGEYCSCAEVFDKDYFDIKLRKPEAAHLPDGSIVDYAPRDISCGDLDGDGEYEIVVKWNAGTSSEGMYAGGYDGPVLLDAYKLDGTVLWKKPINLGVNIYADEHNTQFLVYDFDGDGCAEITCQTAAGSMDAEGMYVTEVSLDETIRSINNETDYRDEYGRVLRGEELFTVFNGADGKAVDTIYYPISRCDVNVFGDSIGNRATRFLADVSYLDGITPYAVYWRGYYTSRDGLSGRTGVFGACFDGERLSVKYAFDTYDVENSIYASEYRGVMAYTEGNEKYIGQGNHNITTADVDSDGKDEVISGSLCFEVDDNDKLMPKWCSFRGHGDALHIGDYDPTHAGLEYFSVHEDGGKNVILPDGTEKILDYGMTVYDAATGEELFHTGYSADTKHAVMANIGQEGYYVISGSTGIGAYICKGNGVFEKTEAAYGTRNRIFWNGDIYDEFNDSGIVTSWDNENYEVIFNRLKHDNISASQTYPAFQADILGDWREELICPTDNGEYLTVFFTTDPTNYKLKTLMHDPVYRSGVCAEQTASNIMPHVGFYMDKEMFPEEIPTVKMVSEPNKKLYAKGSELRTDGLQIEACYENGSTKIIEETEYQISGYDPDYIGEQIINVTYKGQTMFFKVTVSEILDIFISRLPNITVNYQGAPLNADGLAVSARYSDGSVEELKSDEYSISYSSDTLGTQEVTVTYMDKSTSFEVSVIEPNAAALNRNYYNGSTESSLMTIPVGTLAGNFTLKHKVMVNSMPADCTADKNDTNGFFMRFINTGRTQIGGGWYLSSADDDVLVSWKGAPTQENPVQAVDLCRIEPGKTYTFKYEFRDVGTSTENGAYVNVEVIDEDGNTIGSATGLDLRNFTQTNYGKETYITAVQVYNQARSDSPGSVTIDDVSAYGTGGTVSVEGTIVTAELEGITQNERVIAAKYDNDILTKVEMFDSLELGDNALEASFIPYKVFLWSGMIPLCDPNTSSLAN